MKKLGSLYVSSKAAWVFMSILIVVWLVVLLLVGAGAGVLCRASTKKKGGDDKKKQIIESFIPSPIGDLKPRVEQHFTATFLRSAFGICDFQAAGMMHAVAMMQAQFASNM